MNEKMMEIWLRPIQNGGYLEAELRQKDHADAFPMAGLTFQRRMLLILSGKLFQINHF
ncbi:MAG: hypothetical protein IPH84_17195 [Bacteroidales bacterium]|nr:hypothetical protein [Bacteroidales bacterium]